MKQDVIGWYTTHSGAERVIFTLTSSLIQQTPVDAFDASPQKQHREDAALAYVSCRMTLRDHVCEACVMSVPGRAGISSPVGFHGVCPVFVLFNFLACHMTFVKSCY